MSTGCRVTETKTDNDKTAKTKTQTATKTATKKTERKKKTHAARHTGKKLHSTHTTHCKLAVHDIGGAHIYTYKYLRATTLRSKFSNSTLVPERRPMELQQLLTRWTHQDGDSRFESEGIWRCEQR